MVQVNKSVALPASADDELAKLLFHLKWLSSTVEATLGLTITAQQKLEWVLKFDSRNPSHVV